MQRVRVVRPSDEVVDRDSEVVGDGDEPIESWDTVSRLVFPPKNLRNPKNRSNLFLGKVFRAAKFTGSH